jgi:hypothetical protein
MVEVSSNELIGQIRVTEKMIMGKLLTAGIIIPVLILIVPNHRMDGVMDRIKRKVIGTVTNSL